MSRSKLAVWVGIAIVCALAGCGSSAPINDTPILSGLFPSDVTAGSASFTLFVQGLEFVDNSQIYWNGQALTTTLNQSTEELSATISAQLISQVGTAEVTVFTPAPGGGTSNPLTFFIDQGGNPAPTITSISPTSIAPGGTSGFTLTVNGSGFVSTSVVVWNGQALTTTVTSSSQMSAQVPATDIASAGTALITVSTPAPGGGVSNSVTFQITNNPSSGVFPLLISTNPQGGAANGASFSPQADSTGRFVAFTSQANNLVSDGPSGSVYVRDNCLGAAANCVPATFAVDVALDGGAPNSSSSGDLTISANGRYVAFASTATNLVTGVSSGHSNIFLRDTCLGPAAPAGCTPGTILISANDAGTEANGSGILPAISSDGRFVAFESSASDLGDANSAGTSEIYVRDTCLGSSAPANCVPRTILVSADSSGLPDASPSHLASISGDGRFVAFEAVRQGAKVSSSETSIQVRDTCLGSSAPAGCVPSFIAISADDTSIVAGNSPSLSTDGRYLAFTGNGQLYLTDICQGPDAQADCTPSTILTSVSVASGSSMSVWYIPAVSATGRFVTFAASAVGSVGETSGSNGIGIYVLDSCVGATAPCAPATSLVSSAPTMPASNVSTTNILRLPPTTADGRFAVFFSLAPQSVPAQKISGKGDVFLTSNPAH